MIVNVAKGNPEAYHEVSAMLDWKETEYELRRLGRQSDGKTVCLIEC